MIADLEYASRTESSEGGSDEKDLETGDGHLTSW